MTETYPLWDEEKVNHARGFVLQRTIGALSIVRAFDPEFALNAEVRVIVDKLIAHFRDQGDLVREEDIEVENIKDPENPDLTIFKARWGPATQHVQVEIHGYEDEPISMMVSDTYRNDTISLVKYPDPTPWLRDCDSKSLSDNEVLHFRRSGWNPNTQRWTYHQER